MNLTRNHIFFHDRHTNTDVSEFKKESVCWVVSANTNSHSHALICHRDQRVCLHDFLDFDIDEVVERIYMLFDEATQAQKRWNQLPFLLKTCENCQIRHRKSLKSLRSLSYLDWLQRLVRFILAVELLVALINIHLLLLLLSAVIFGFHVLNFASLLILVASRGPHPSVPMI